MARARPWVWAIAALAAVSCSDDVGLPDAQPAVIDAAPGTLQVSWTIGHGGAPLTCAQIAAQSVTVEIVEEGRFFGDVDSFSCTSGMGMSRALAPGVYNVTLTLTGSGGTLGGPIVKLGVAVSSNQSATVEPVAFDVDPSGTLQFRITTGVDNCAAMPGGAGITATRIELRDGSGTCVPTTFNIAAGATSGAPAGTYASNCPGPLYGCIAADQDITATGVASGQHMMAITGLVGASACWNRTSSFIVRAAGLTTPLSPQMLIRDNGLCP